MSIMDIKLIFRQETINFSNMGDSDAETRSRVLFIPAFVGFILCMATAFFFLMGIIYIPIYVLDMDSYNSYKQKYCEVIAVEQYNKTCQNKSGLYYYCYYGIWSVLISDSPTFNNSFTYPKASITTGTANLPIVVTDWLAVYQNGSIYQCWTDGNDPNTVQWDGPGYPDTDRLLLIIYWSLFPALLIVFCLDIILIFLCATDCKIVFGILSFCRCLHQYD